MAADLSRLVCADPIDLMASLYALREQPHTLHGIDHKAGINECPVDCLPKKLPCPKHTLWVHWHKEGADFREIATRWDEKFGERVRVAEVRRAFRRKNPAKCGCPGQYEVCRHVVERSCLPVVVQGLLLWLLFPDVYTEPPLSEEPILAKLRPLKAALMAERTAKGLHPRHPADFLQAGLAAAVDEDLRRNVTRTRQGAVIPGRLTLRQLDDALAAARREEEKRHWRKLEKQIATDIDAKQWAQARELASRLPAANCPLPTGAPA